jgi:hypothetical protein
MITISCKNGSIFCGMDEDFNGAEEKLQIAYYKAQGCIVETVETFKFGPECKCDHCTSLEHEFETLIEEIIEKGF